MIQLTFETFGLENSTNCEYDFVEVSYNSYSEKFCGDSLPGPFVSAGTTMTVRLLTDESETGQGFKAEWRSIPEPTTTTSTPGPFESHPSYPANYENNYEKVNFVLNSYFSIKSIKTHAFRSGFCPHKMDIWCS